MISPQRSDVKVTVMPDVGRSLSGTMCGLWGSGPGTSALAPAQPTVPLTFDTCYLRCGPPLVQTWSRDLLWPNSSWGEGECQKVAFDRFLQHHVQVGKINIVHMDPYSIILSNPTLWCHVHVVFRIKLSKQKLKVGNDLRQNQNISTKIVYSIFAFF